MQTRSIIFAAAVALLVGSAAPALASPTPSTPMSLLDAVDYALMHSPTVAQKYASVGSAYNALGKARDSAFPVPTGSLSNISQKSSNYNAYAIIQGVSTSSVFSQNTAQI